MLQLGSQLFVHPNATVRNSRLGALVEIGEGPNFPLSPGFRRAV